MWWLISLAILVAAVLVALAVRRYSQHRTEPMGHTDDLFEDSDPADDGSRLSDDPERDAPDDLAPRA